MTTPRLFVGEVPPGYPAALMPGPPARVVGGMANPFQVVAVFEDSTRRIAAALEDAFVRAGYERPAPTPGAGFMSGYGGFGFCGDSGTVNAESLGGAQRYMARVTFQPHHGRSSCSGRERAFASPAVRLKLPPLLAPPNAQMRGAGGGGRSDEVSSDGELVGPSLTPAAVVAHFATQLTAAGWRASTPAVSDQVVAQFFEAADSSGGPWTGTLTATRNGERILVSINMRPLPRP